MTHLDRRQVLFALAAMGAFGTGSTAVAQGACTPLDLSAGRDIGAAWLASNPGADLQKLRKEILPRGLCEEALEALDARVKADFRAGAIFSYRGWRLSQTEARLFAVATSN